MLQIRRPRHPIIDSDRAASQEAKSSPSARTFAAVTLIYVNTLMLQRILTEPAWLARMTQEDHRALTPAIHSHINPYGRLTADLSRRIDFEPRMAA
jgi:hypothetical protein